MAHKGIFENDENEEYSYEVAQFRTEGQDYKPGSGFDDSDLLISGDMILRVTDEDGGISYRTMNLPLEGWEDVEVLLTYDYGSEGSL